MKTLFNILSIVLKIMMAIFSIIGVILTVRMVILARPAVEHIDAVADETNDIDPDDEDQDVALTTETYRKFLSDPRVRYNKFVNAVDYCVGKFVTFVGNL